MNAAPPTGIVTRRRIALQLTPLLDLLFIVLFAQYIDLQEAARLEVAQASERRANAEFAEREADRLRSDALSQLSQLTSQLEQAELEKRRITRELELARAESAQEGRAREELEQVAARDRQVIGRLVQDVLGLEQDVIYEALAGASPMDRQRLRASLEEMGQMSGAAVVHHLRATDELKKRADLWEVYVGDDNLVRVTLVGDEAARNLQVRSADQLANTIAELARQRGEPKSLVVVLLSWSNADRQTRDLVRKGLDDMITVLKGEWPGKRIEVAPLGYTPVPP